MINFSTITAAVQAQLETELAGKNYLIKRNDRRNDNPEIASRYKAWVCVYRGNIEYEAYTTGSGPWLAKVQTIVEIQVANMQSAEQADNDLTAAEAEVMAALDSDRTLGGSVLISNGYMVEYETNIDTQYYWNAAIIKINSEVRT